MVKASRLIDQHRVFQWPKSDNPYSLVSSLYRILKVYFSLLFDTFISRLRVIINMLCIENTDEGTKQNRTTGSLVFPIKSILMIT